MGGYLNQFDIGSSDEPNMGLWTHACYPRETDRTVQLGGGALLVQVRSSQTLIITKQVSVLYRHLSLATCLGSEE